MRRPPNTKHRSERKRQKKARAPVEEARRTFEHPMFGSIPMIPRVTILENGTEHRGWQFDPDYEPPLPKGAIRGNVRQQEFCSMCHEPRYFFVDISRVCLECRKPFVFSAREQKHWYETLKFHFDATARHCRDCRRKRRSDQALRRGLAEAKSTARKHAEDPSAQLLLAEVLVRYFERFQQGNLDEAVSASRKARRLLRGHSAREMRRAVFWEGKSQSLAGRRATARALFETFLASGSVGRGYSALYDEAKRWLAADAREAKA